MSFEKKKLAAFPQGDYRLARDAVGRAVIKEDHEGAMRYMYTTKCDVDPKSGVEYHAGVVTLSEIAKEYMVQPRDKEAALNHTAGRLGTVAVNGGQASSELIAA